MLVPAIVRTTSGIVKITPDVVKTRPEVILIRPESIKIMPEIIKIISGKATEMDELENAVSTPYLINRQGNVVLWYLV